MVQFKCLLVFTLFAAHKTDSDLLSDESKVKIVIKTKAPKAAAAYNKNNFQCDLTLLPQQKKLMYFGARSDSSAADLSYDLYRWPKNKNGHVIVPYSISKSSQYSSKQLRLIRDSINAIEEVSCIRFQPRRFAKDFLQIFSGKYCKSHLGRIGGAQELSLNWRLCFEKGIIIHELLHALGYIHMHSRPDRDRYVKILWKNIQPNWYKEFDKVHPSNFQNLGTKYDYQSIMHYGATAFTKNGGITIATKNSEPIGQRFGLSEGDIRRINTKYNCKVETHCADFLTEPKYHVRTGVSKLFSKSYRDGDEDDEIYDDEIYDDDDELSDI